MAKKRRLVASPSEFFPKEVFTYPEEDYLITCKTQADCCDEDGSRRLVATYVLKEIHELQITKGTTGKKIWPK